MSQPNYDSEKLDLDKSRQPAEGAGGYLPQPAPEQAHPGYGQPQPHPEQPTGWQQQQQFQQPSPAAYGQPQYYYVQQPGATDVRTIAMFAHLSPLASFIAPIIIWAVYKDKPGYELARRAAARALNLSLTLTIILFIALPLIFVVLFLGIAITANDSARDPNPIAILIAMAIQWIITLALVTYGIMAMVFHILGAVRAHNGEDYRYRIPYFRMVRED